MQGSYWIICGPHASVSWLTHGSRKTMGQVTPVMPIQWPTATYPRWGKGKDGYLSQENFRRWRCGRTFLFPEGPSYFQIVMSCGKRWPKNRIRCSENSKNQFCWSVHCTSIRLVNEKKQYILTVKFQAKLFTSFFTYLREWLWGPNEPTHWL